MTHRSVPSVVPRAAGLHRLRMEPGEGRRAWPAHPAVETVRPAPAEYLQWPPEDPPQRVGSRPASEHRQAGNEGKVDEAAGTAEPGAELENEGYEVDGGDEEEDYEDEAYDDEDYEDVDEDEDDDDYDAPVALGASERAPKVIVLERSGNLSAELARAARGMVPEPEILKLDHPGQIVGIAEDEDPDVIVVSPDEVTTAGLKRLAQVHRSQPKIVILLSDNDRTWSATQLAATGASDVLPANPSASRLRSKLRSALGTAAQLRSTSVIVTERVVVQEAAPAPAPQVAAAGAVDLAQVYTVASASGGTGKTVLATNLATYLVKATGRRVLLIDLDLQFGELAPVLHLRPQRTIQDVGQDPEELMGAAVDHACGFRVLCAPGDPLSAEEVGPPEVTAILEVARREFDYVVVDTSPILNETCLAAFDQSEKIILTANMDVPSLKNMRRYLETIEKLDVPAAKCALVVNRADSGIGLDIKGVGQLFPQGFLAVLPTAREVPWATNMGVPLLHGNPKSEFSRLLVDSFARLLAAGPQTQFPGQRPDGPPPRRSGFLGLKKGRN